MKIAIFRELSLAFPGGVTRVLHEVLRHIHKTGHEAIVFAPDSSTTECLGAPVVSVPCVSLPLLKKTRFVLARICPDFVEAKLKEFRPDVVHVMHPMTLGLTGIYCAKTLQIPTIASYHTQYHLYLKYYDISVFKKAFLGYTRWMFNKADIVLSPSESVTEQLLASGFKNVFLWSRGVDGDMFSPHKRSQLLRERLFNADRDDLVLLYVGRLYKEKNLDVLVRAVRRIDRIKLVFIGDGPCRKKLGYALRNKNVVFTGHMNREDLPQYYASADIFVFPSTTEGCPNVVLEAMASGLPVIGADSYGTRDLVTESGGGLLFEGRDAGALYQCIMQMLTRNDLRIRYGNRCRRYALTRSWDAILNQLVAYYSRVMNSSAADQKTSCSMLQEVSHS